MRTWLAAPVIAVSLLVGPASAGDYRWELEGGYDRDFTPGDFLGGDVDTLTLGGTWHFEPVKTDGVPLEEAAYLARSSYVSAIAARFELFGHHLNAQAANVGYYLPGTMFFGSVGVSRSEQITALSSSIVLTDHYTRWFGSVGVAPMDGLLITTAFQEGGYDPNITARHVGKLPNGRFYAGGVTIVSPDEGDTFFGLDFDYYFDLDSSLGASYADAGERFEIRGQKFFNERWAVGVSAYTSEGIDGVGLRVTWRN